MCFLGPLLPAQRRIVRAFVADGRRWPVAWIDNGCVGQGQQLLPDAAEKQRLVAALIDVIDEATPEGIAHESRAVLRFVERNIAAPMPRCVQYREGECADHHYSGSFTPQAHQPAPHQLVSGVRRLKGRKSAL